MVQRMQILRPLLFVALVVMIFQNCDTVNKDLLIEPLESEPDSVPLVPKKSKAFSGAFGYGAYLEDWSEYKVVEVTRLSDTISNPQPGELRFALSRIAGPGIIIFRVGREIILNKTLSIMDSNIYIAGHSAPSPGITLRGNPETKCHSSTSVVKMWGKLGG